MPNRLAGESSPYLLQHQNNPVDWYPWGPEALARARSENRPIFLSIGYSACHWCHVMEHESFENDAIADLLNRDFVCIKVDREERPDLDQIYMNAVQLLTGRGGWPMSVFLTPELQPFYGGTYWPPRASRGMPGFDQVLTAVVDAWQNRRDHAITQAARLTEHLQQAALPEAGEGELAPTLLSHAAVVLERIFDPRHGGFGQAPKFPHPMDLQVLLRVARRWPREGIIDMVRLTLDRMAAGGIYDHLGGGFARYSVDEVWLVPHFEKMLYDNALLTKAYLEGYQVTGDEAYATVVRETLDYLLHDLCDPLGGFYSTEDADSEGEEGKFYVWSAEEVRTILGDDAAKTFAYVYDVTTEGNFDGHNILNRPKTIAQCASLLGRDATELATELAAAREKLLAVRCKRVRPGLDDKVLVSWNGLAIDAFAAAGCVLNEPRYIAAAGKAADFILTNLRRSDGRLLHTWRGGVAKLDAYLDDYAALINSLVSVYEATFEPRWITEAVRLADVMLDQFADRDGDGFYYTARDHESLIARQKDLHDSSVPSGNALAATALARLAKLTARDDFAQAAQRTLHLGLGLMERSPVAAGQMLLALDFHVGPTPEIVLIAPTAGDLANGNTAEALADLRRRYIPNKVVAATPNPTAPEITAGPLAPLFAGKPAADQQPTAYVCYARACQAPAAGREAIGTAWDTLAGPQ